MKFRNLFLFFFTLFFIFSCSEKTVKSFPENYVFGIIETANRIFSQTRIRVYDNNSQVLDSLTVPLAGIYEAFVLPTVSSKNMLYLPAEGTFTKATSALFGLNTKTGATRISNYSYGAYTVISDNEDENIVFLVNSKFYLIRWDYEENKEIAKQDLSNYFFEHLKIHENKIYFFGYLHPDNNPFVYISHLLILNKNTLEIEKDLDLTEIGTGHYSSYINKNQLFFTNNWKPQDIHSIPDYTLSVLNLENHQITTYRLSEEYPYQIVLYQDFLIISHNIPQDPRMKKISTFDLNTHETKLYKLAEDADYGFYQIAVQDHYLYALESYNLHKYDIENNFEEVAVYPTKTLLGSKKYPTFGNSSHVSAFFLNPKND